MKVAIVKASELGTNCWAAERFVGGVCKRVQECKYVEKNACKAYLKLSQTKTVFANGYDNGIEYHI